MELFILIGNPVFIRKSDNSDAWLVLKIKGRFRLEYVLKSIPRAFEVDLSERIFLGQRNVSSGIDMILYINDLINLKHKKVIN